MLVQANSLCYRCSMGIHALAAGPLAWDVELVGKALAPRRLLGGLGQVFKPIP